MLEEIVLRSNETYIFGEKLFLVSLFKNLNTTPFKTVTKIKILNLKMP